jgi:hypothetical protein
MARIAVAHLVRKQNGIEPLRRFLDSYAACHAGIEHDLVFILKGFQSEPERKPYRELFASFRHQAVDVPDEGYDITSYWLVAGRFDHAYFCFLNSFSVLLAPDWLLKLHSGLARPGVGLAGATGSYQSFWPSSLASYMWVSRKIKHRGPIKDLLIGIPFARHLNYLRRRLLYRSSFSPFPNYHIRTNAFLVRRDFMRGAMRTPVSSKMDSYRFESGRHSMTAQALRAGLEPVIVGADGELYMKPDWHESNTFWQSRQENLLVADNQTSQYSEGPPETRDILSYMAWGELARPG